MNSHWIDTKKLRHFGWIVGTIFILFGYFRFKSLLMPFSILGGALILAASLFPRALKVPYELWMKLGALLGEVNSRVLLTVVFFFILTPVALVRKIFRKTDLKEYRDAAASTYRKPSRLRDVSHFEYQF